MINEYRGVSVYYDGYLLNDIMTIRKINLNVLPTKKISYIGLAHQSIRKTQFATYDSASVEVEGTLIGDVLGGRDKLARMLHTNGEDKPLIIGDQPERYLMCQVDGRTQLGSRYVVSDVKMSFTSPDYFWRATNGSRTYAFDTEGRVLVENKGSAPTPPIIDIDFLSDCGYLAIVTPKRYITLGNALEEDDINVPPSEYAMNEELAESNSWTRLTDASSWIPDYIKMTSSGTAKHDEWGMLLDGTTLGTSDQWHGHAYARNFTAGATEIEADNFNLKSRVDIADLSGSRNRTMAMLIVVMDEQNRPIMSTSVYDVSADKNELTVTFKIPETAPGKEKHSKIIHSAKIPRLNGFINMSKSGQNFEWLVQNNATTGTSNSIRTLKVGDIVHLNANARTIYDWNGRALNLDQRIIGQQMKVFEVRNSPKGRYGLRNVRYDYVEGFFEPDAIKETSVQGTTSVEAVQVKHAISDQSLAQLRPYKVFVWQAKWGATQAYSKFSINSVVVNRLYTTDKLELINTFMAGDHLTIDNQTGQIIHNGQEFSGFNDYDSRYFMIDGGVSELALQPSSWATMPQAKITVEDRWF